jgi:methylated-DNA-[protein]-cysteine S-methyltransferase
MKRVENLKKLPSDAVYDVMPSPVGALFIVVSSKGIHKILWQDEKESQPCQQLMATIPHSPDNPLLKETKKQLKEYFLGKRTCFELPLVIEGTAFQISAWKQLQKIPYGETISYGEQAKRLGDKSKARAVGGANGLNPISIVIPCHRVIGSNGHLVGFGGGLDNKALLLELERK